MCTTHSCTYNPCVFTHINILIYTQNSFIYTNKFTHSWVHTYVHTLLQTHSSVRSHFSLLMANGSLLTLMAGHASTSQRIGQLHRSSTQNLLPSLTSEGVTGQRSAPNKIEPTWAGARVVHITEGGSKLHTSEGHVNSTDSAFAWPPQKISLQRPLPLSTRMTKARKQLLLHILQLSQSGLQEPSKLPEHTGGGSPGVSRGHPMVSTLLNSLL